MKNILIRVSVRGMLSAAILAMFGIVCLNPAPALAQSHCYDGWTAAYSCSQGCGRCGGGGGGYTPPPRDYEAERRQQLLNEAHTANQQGVQFYKNGDWAKAVTAFQEAANKNPDDSVIRQNLANAQTNLQTQQTELRTQQQEKASAARMHQSIQSLAQTFNVAPPNNAAPAPGGLDFNGGGTTASSGNSSGGLDFTAAIAASPTPRTGAFGSKESNPTLEKRPENAGKVGTNAKPGDELASIAQNVKPLEFMSGEAASEKAREGLDTGVKQQGSLSDVKVATPTATMLMPEIPPVMANDKLIKEGLDRYNKLLPDLKKAREEVKRAQATRDQAKEPGAKAAALTALNAAQTKSDGLQIAAESAVKQVTERTLYLKKLPVFNAPPTGPTPPAAGSTPPVVAK